MILCEKSIYLSLFIITAMSLTLMTIALSLSDGSKKATYIVTILSSLVGFVSFKLMLIITSPVCLSVVKP